MVKASVLLAALVGAVLSASLAVAAPATAATAVSSTPAPSWSVNGRVYASVVVGNQVILGGSFTQATSSTGTVVSHPHLVAFDVRTGELVRSFAATANGDVRALVSDGSTVWVGGSFTQIGSVSRSRIAAVSASNGALRTGFTSSAGASVLGLELGNGKLYVGGDFTTLGGKPRSRVGAVDAVTGALDTGFVPSADNRVAAIRLSPSGSTLYLAGSFNNVNGAARAGVAAVNATVGGTLSVVFAGSVAPSLSLDVNPDGSAIYVGQGGTANSAVAWRRSTGVRLWANRADGDVQAVRYGAGTVFFGFHDGYQGTTTSKLLAADAVTGAVDAAFRPVFDGFWGVFALSVTDAYLVAGGQFTTVSGVSAGNWARFPLG